MHILSVVLVYTSSPLSFMSVLSFFQETSLQKQLSLSSRVSVAFQSLSHVRLFATPWTAARQASLSFTISQSLLKLMSIESVMPSDHLILCRPLLLLPSIFPSIRVFFSESAVHIRWPKYRSFCFSISPSNEYSGLISSRIDWCDLFAFQETLENLLQHHSSKAPIYFPRGNLLSNTGNSAWCFMLT